MTPAAELELVGQAQAGDDAAFETHRRIVIVLYDYLDMPLQEIAALTGASYAAGLRRLYRAIRQLGPGLEVLEYQP